MDFSTALQQEVLILDGAMGTMVQTLALDDAAFGGAEFRMLTDLLTFSRPRDLEGIHLAYLRAGAHILETNTFGATPLRLREFEFSRIDPSRMQSVPAGLDLRRAGLADIAWHLNVEACRAARAAIAHYRTLPEYDGRPLFAAGSIGPSNYVVSRTQANLKKASFGEAMDNFYHQVTGLIDGGADILLFETQQDLLELKAGIIAAHKAMRDRKKRLPIMAQLTVNRFAKMMIFNTDAHAAYAAIAGMGIDVFGINCTLGPEEMGETVERMARFCSHPISIVPNAGQPIAEDGKTCYKLRPDGMTAALEPLVSGCGVNIIGGCCGTNPDHIRALSARFRGAKPRPREAGRQVYVSGPQNAVALDTASGLLRIGERLNVRGSKKVRDAVEGPDGIQMDALEAVATEQIKDLGLDIIDVCMDSNVVPTETVLPQVIHELTGDFKGAMCLDSFSVEALAKAIEAYPGRPIINSISLEEYAPGVSKLDAVIEATRAHDPIYIALVNGPLGPAITAQEKLGLAAGILKQAREKHGVTPDRILIDVNAYPIGSESTPGLNFCAETLQCLPLIKALDPGVKTSIGAGNLTNGLAQKPYMRKVLTSVFLDEARQRGLDCAILNPEHYVPAASLPESDVALARKVIFDHDMAAFEELERIALVKKSGVAVKKTDYAELPPAERVCRKIMDGYKEREEGAIEKDGGRFPYHDRIVADAAQALDGCAPLAFINDHLMKTMRELGDRFGEGQVSLPHLLKSADVMRAVMQFLEAYMRQKSGAAEDGVLQYKGVVVLGTVYQDVHSIGKDLAKTLLENYGYRVIDLGVQVPLEQFVETARRENADAIGLSALLVQTSNHMTTVSRMLQEQNSALPILIGGAPVNPRHAGYVAMWGQDDIDKIRGQVFYCESAMEGVNVMNALRDAAQSGDLTQRNRARLIAEYRRAKGMADEEEKLLAELKWRRVSFKHHEIPRANYGISRVEFKLSKLHLDNKSLFSLNWKFGKQSSWKQKGVEPGHLQRLKQEWVEKAEENQWIVPQAVFGVFPVQSEGEELVIYDPGERSREIGRLRFTACVGKGRKDKFSIAHYFRSRESGLMDAAGLAVCSAAGSAPRAIEDFKRRHDTEAALYLQGLSDRVAEDLAEYTHKLLCQRISSKEKRGCRYSPGYTAMPDLKYNKMIYELLCAGEIGVTLTSANEFDPPSTTACAVCFHDDAGYT